MDMWDSIKRFFLGEPPKPPALPEIPKAEAPKAEPPKVEAPKVEAPKVEVKVGVPCAEPKKALPPELAPKTKPVEDEAKSHGIIVKSGPTADIGKVVKKPE